ncbi:MAG: DUF5777 family beta-barrel protein [Bacteroidales bacterium]
MKKFLILSLAISLCFTPKIYAQDLLSMLDSMQAEEETVYADGTFKSVRLINGYTSEIAAKNELIFSISHRFGNVNQGVYDFFGLDQSTIRFGFEYGLNDRIDLGIGRSNYEKLYDGFIKVKLTKQSSGEKSFPFTITLLEGMSVKTLKWTNEAADYPNTARLFYIHELFIARKFNEKLSIQLSPVIIHRNMVKTREDQNTVGALGVGGRYRITNRFTAVCEYYYLFPGNTANQFNNSLAFGVEIETGGHVFQLHFSNSTGMTEKAFIPETTGRWMDGDVNLGFNIIRLFSFR